MPEKQLRANPSPRACTACRTAHIKCNGLGPVCDRCLERGSKCVWVESRRGFRPTKDAGPSASDNSSTGSQAPSQPLLPQHLERDQPAGAMQNDQLIDLFYKWLHPSHPFVFPRRMQDEIPEFLKAVMRFGGSHYMPRAKLHTLNTATGAQLLSNAPENAFKVQAMALLSMILFSRNEQNEGQAYMTAAIDLALALGMHQQEFAVRFGNNDPTREESWRRTWWDLYVVEGLSSFFGGQIESARLRTVVTDVLLPGDCERYHACAASRDLRSYQDMQDRAFYSDNFRWSSFAYKIEAMHLLNEVFTLGPDTFSDTDSQVELVDQRIQNFRLSLPTDKQDALTADGHVDEVMFAALMTASLAEIALHRPRSSFISIQNHYRTACTPNPTTGITAIRYLPHDAKAVRAANSITNLVTMPSALTIHTPCFTCAMAVASTVQLPAMVLSRPSEGAALKKRIRLLITAMGSISEVWPIALATKEQVAHFAREILDMSRDASSTWSTSQSSIGTPTMTELDYGVIIANDNWLVDLIGDAGETLLPDPTNKMPAHDPWDPSHA